MLTTLEIAVLALAPWPLYRLLSIPVFRQSFFCFAMRVVIILFVYVLAVVLVSIYAPLLLHVGALLALLLLALERYRARPAYGTRRGLAPGSLSLVPRGPWVDDEHFAKAASRYGPIFKTSHYFRPMTCVIGARRGIALMTTHEEELSPPTVRFNRFIPRGFLRYMGQADHDKYKKIFRRVLSRSALQTAEPGIRALIAQGLEKMSAGSLESPGHGVKPKRYLSKMLMAVFAELFFGISCGSENFDRLQELYLRIDIKKASCASSRQEVDAANSIAEIIAAQITHFENLRASGRELPACYLAEFIRQDLGGTIDRTILLNFVYMVQAGRADVMGLLTWVLKLLCDNEQWILRVRDDFNARSDSIPKDTGSLASRVVKEALRMEQSEFIVRITKNDVNFEDFLIPKGWYLRICVREGHRDADIFAEPNRFNPDRFLENSYPKEEYSPLGMTRHSCLGAQIVDQLGTIFVAQLARQYDCRAMQDGPREYGTAHWEPSSLFRVAMVPAAAKAA